jgi:ribonucleoside-diphosphate reductase alpha chain
MASSKGNTSATTSVKVHNGLLPTPPMPDGLPGANLTENARKVLMKRYVRRGDDGQPAETVEEMFWRVAYHVAKVEEQWDADVQQRTVEYYHLLSSKKFFPNSPTFTGAGTPLGQLAACFVLPITDDMGRDSAGIFQTLRDAALIQQTGGGNGFSFSRLRPKGALVQTSAGQATGPVGFLRVYDHAFGEIAQGGCLLPETLVFTNKGLLRLDEIVNSDVTGWQEHVLSIPTDEGLKDSARGYNNGVADVLRVHTRQGLSITGTPNHKVKVMTNAGPEWKEIQDLAKGDWIVVRLGEYTGKLQALKKPDQKHGNQVMPQLPSILDEEFAFFLGYLAGDGFVAQGEQDHRVGVSVAHSSYLMEEMPALLERLFNVKVHKMQKPNDASATFVMDNRAIKEFLLMNGLGKRTSRDVTVPRSIRQSPPNIVGAYVRGLLEAHGALSHGYPCLVTTSSQLAREVATLLIGLGCPVGIRTTSPGLDHWGDAETYQVRITSTVGLQAWREKIGCDQRSRFVAAHAWESDLRRETSYVLPNARYWFQPVLDTITLEQIDKKGRGRNINFRATEPRLRRQILRYYREDRNLTRSGYDLLKAEHPEAFENAPSVEGFWFVEVGGVEAAGKSLTLDLEVADNHTYLAYGMVTHNTRRGANMAVLRVDHPDVEDFVTSKTNENHITNFNISVGITDAFMRAVKEDGDWELRFPDIAEMKQHKFSGTLEQAEKEGITIRGYRKLKARELFNKIVKQAHHNGEPGVLFLDASNRSNPVPHLYPLEATNPCVTGDTLIYTDQGLRRADELAAEGFEINVATDARFGTDAFLPATHVFQTGTKPVYRLITREGYELRLTEDHRVMTSRGWVETKDLQPGERVHILNRKGGFGSAGTLEEGHVLGWLVGDGTANVVRAVLSFFGNEKQELAPAFAQMVTNLVEKPNQRRAYPVGIVQVEERDEARIASDRLRVWAARYGITEEKKHFVPSAVFAGSENIQRGFLQALFTADGQVNDGGEKGCSVRLSASHLPLLKDVQRLLLNFGIASRIYENRRLAGYRPMPDGKGGTKEYFHQPQHDLAISKSSLIRFANEIGFLTEAKQSKLANYLSRMVRGPYEESFLATVFAVEPDGVEAVYDLHQPDTHSFIANGFVVHNCGEQWLGPYENCCLGSVNLNEHCGPEGTVDWEKLRQSVVLSTRFLDDVVEANAYVPAVPQLTEAAHKARRIGLGIMGLADLMYHVGVRYGSPEGQEFGAQVMEFVRYHAMQTSIELAEERGPFPAIEGSIYDMDNMSWTPPQSLVRYQHDWSRPAVAWDAIVGGIKKHGIRNAAQTTVAPTGTIATVAGCEGYGCEPVFALAYFRHVNDNGKDLKLTYASPRFDEALKKLGLGEEKRQEIVEQVMREGTCQQIEELPQAVRDTFVVSADITAEEHVRMQAVLQAFVDNSLSKTVNFHETATEEDVAKAYMLAWELGCKGITVYVTGSREKVVLETKATAEKKDIALSGATSETRSADEARVVSKPEISAAFPMDTKKPRPRALRGKTFSVETPVGKAFITINENGGEQPFEAFINTAKAGSETAAVSEAIGRLISYVLRMTSPTKQTDRMREVVRQLLGIGGGRSLGLGPNRVRSLPDGIGQVLDMYLREKSGALPVIEEKKNGNGGANLVGHKIEDEAEANFMPMKIGDLCPECGEAAVVNEEGCRKCYACGYSEC